MKYAAVFAVFVSMLFVHLEPVAIAAPKPQPILRLPMLPSIARVTFELVRDKSQMQALIVEEVNLPRGDWQGEPLDFYVAFGAPGVPQAVDVRIVSVMDGLLEAESDALGEPVAITRAPSRPPNVHSLLGRDTMAGFVIHLGKIAFAKALAPGNMATLRIRSLVLLPDVPKGQPHTLVVRLGASGSSPLPVGRLSVHNRPGAPVVARAEARLCGASADPHPLAVEIAPKPAVALPAPHAPSAPPAIGGPEAPIAPVLAVRHVTDDLCVALSL
ncbi:MAG: hypothetical protein FWD73_06685 [Polyangiaceae bacterium]|nr:hypothetical protein [Polyangiaceae bacterium]